MEKEGPIHRDVVKRRVADLFHVRMGNRINLKLDNAINHAITKKLIKVDSNFLWSQEMKFAKLRVYNGGKERRSIDQIPPQEITNAIIECVRNSISISENDLIKETARLFGLRATKKVSAEISWIIKNLLSTKYLVLNSERIKLNSKK